MRIFSKRAFRFDHPSGSQEVERVYVRDQEFSDVPEWVAETSTFKSAVEHDFINVIESKKDEKAAEKSASKKAVKEEK